MRCRQLSAALRPQLPTAPVPSTSAPSPASPSQEPHFAWNFFESTREATDEVRMSGDVDHAGAPRDHILALELMPFDCCIGERYRFNDKRSLGKMPSMLISQLTLVSCYAEC